MHDRRGSLRFDKVFTVYITTADGMARGIARNISAAGLYVETQAAALLGGRLRLTFTGEDGTEMTVARVDAPFLGNDEWVCVIEDSQARWLARPMSRDAQVEVLASR